MRGWILAASVTLAWREDQVLGEANETCASACAREGRVCTSAALEKYTAEANTRAEICDLAGVTCQGGSVTSDAIAPYFWPFRTMTHPDGYVENVYVGYTAASPLVTCTRELLPPLKKDGADLAVAKASHRTI